MSDLESQLSWAPMCKEHKKNRMAYIEHSEWVEEQLKKGLKQKQCSKCKYWFWPSEFGDLA